MQDSRTFISVIIPCKNSEKYLSKTLESLEKQKINFEVIFVYSHSNDKTLKILNNFNYCNIKKKIIHKECGISEALNIGIKASNGKFIIWIGSDDILMTNYLYKISMIINKEKRFDWFITKSKILSKKKYLKKFIENYKSKRLKKLTFNKLLTENPISAPGVIWSKDFFNKIGKFNEKLIFNSDYDMWLRMYYCKEPLFIDIYSTFYNRHPSSLSSKYFITQFSEQYQVSNLYKEKNLFKKIYHLLKIIIIIIMYKNF